MKPLEVVGYVRQSQDRTGEGLAIARQTEDIEKLVAHRGWTLLAIHQDNDVSASGRAKRPGFEAVLSDLESGRAQGVVAWNLDRLTRNRRDTVRLLETGERNKAVLAFARGSDMDLSTPSGRLTAGVLAEVAAHEVAVKSDRQRRAVQQAAVAGKWVGGRRPFGFEPDGTTIRPAEAGALAEVYNDLLQGVSLGACARKLNKLGLYTPQTTRDGNPSKWTSATLRPTLLNPRYAGLRVVPGPSKKSPKRRKIAGKAVWPAVVSEETWRAVDQLLRDPSRTTRGQAPKRLLTGVARCGVCEGPIHAGASREGHPTYRCKNATGHVVRRIEPVDEYIKEAVLHQLRRPEAAALFLHQEEIDVQQLRNDRQVLQSRLDELAALHAEGDLDLSQLRTGTRLLRERMEEVEAKLADAGRVSVLAPLLDTDDPEAVWDSLDMDRRRAAVGRLFTVTLLPPGRGVRTFNRDTVVIRLRRREEA